MRSEILQRILDKADSQPKLIKIKRWFFIESRIQITKIMNKKKLKVALGISLLPIFGLIFFIDRALLLFLFWLPQSKITTWFEGQKEMASSFTRVLSLGVILGIYWTVKMFI